MSADMECCESLGSLETNNTLTTKLTRKRERLENELDVVRKAQQLLDENPKLKELFDVVAQVRGL